MVSKALSKLTKPNIKIGATVLATVVLGATSLKCCINPQGPSCPPPPAPTLNQTEVAATLYKCAFIEFTQTKIIGLTETASFFTPTPSVTPLPTATMTPAVSDITIKVIEGWYLSDYANLYGTSTEEIMALNGLSSTNIRIGQELKIPLNVPETLTEPLANIMKYERPGFEQQAHAEAWGALRIFGDPDSVLYPNSWWLSDGELSFSDVMSIVIQGETAGNIRGQEAVVARYIYMCGVTSDCNGNTSKQLDFLAYYHAWRESGHQMVNVSSLPAQDIRNLADAISNGNTEYLAENGFSGTLQEGSRDMPFHFANVSSKWNEFLIEQLGRQPDDPEKKFWVLTINEVNRLCPSFDITSPDMTKDTLSGCY